MSRVCFTAMMMIATLAVSVKAQEPAKPAVQEFPQRANMMAEVLKQFDKDGDGKLNDQEREAMMTARKAMGEKMRLAREKEFDKDGDGKLSEQERAAMMAAMQQRHPQMKEMIKRFDKDGDGKLNAEEKKAMMDERARRMRKDGPKALQGAASTNAVPKP